MSVPLPDDETERLKAVRGYDVFDTAPEAEFDDLTHLAAQICGTPISAITLIDEGRQWFKSRIGPLESETPRAISICAHTILGDETLIVPDASADTRFADNPLVTSDPHIRFYAGVPLITPEGQAIGSLCVMDTVPREIDESQQDALRRLARQAVALLEARPATSTEKRQSRQARHESERQRLIVAAEVALRDAQSLRFSEMRYRRLFEAAQDGILILDEAEGTIEDVNPYLCELLGYEPEYFRGKQLWQIGTFHDIAANKDAFHLLQQKEFVRYDDLPLETRDGQIVSVEFVSNVYECADKNVIQCNIRDIRERKRAATAEQEWQRFLQSTLDALGSHIAVLDENGEILTVNRAWQQFSQANGGTPISCGVGTNYIAICEAEQGLWADEAPAVARGIRSVMAGEQALFCLEYPCHSPGEERWFRVCVTRFGGQGPVRTVVAHENISERKRAEAAQARLIALLEATPDFVGIADQAERPVYLNRAARQMLGIAQDEDIAGLSVARMCPDWARAILRKGVLTAIRDGVWSGESAIANRSGGETPISQVILAHKTPRGELEFLSTVARDISERLRAEQALQRANDELELHVTQRTAELGEANESLRVENLEHHETMEALQRAKEEADVANAAKSEFLSRMSHELRTPLNAILGFGQILEKRDFDPLAKESIGYILQGGRHLLDLINEVLDISRVEAGRLELSLEPVALDDVVPEACAMMQPLAAQHNIRLTENSAQEGRSYVLADRQRLKQALINLLANAIKYNREGGEAEVICSQLPQGRISIAVRDTGPGISVADLPRLFTPFERLSAGATAVEGTGLGLVLSQRLVGAMGGTLGVASTLGQGTTFTIELPRAASPLEMSTTSALEAQAAGDETHAGRLYSVLCIEDNPSNMRLIETIFELRPEWTLLPAMDGGGGLEIARRHEPDLILLDLNLPDMHGREVLTRLQQSALTRDIPVIVVSADATPDQIEQLLAAGARAYLTKPLDVAQFLQIMDRFLPTMTLKTPLSRDDKDIV